MTPLRSPASCAAGVLLTGLVFVQAGEASAGAFTVNPTRIELRADTPTVLLSLKSDSDEPLRFQVTGFAWDQKPSGDMDLRPTDEIVFFPALFTLAPHQERKIRIGTTASFGAVEKSYRIFVEELPPLEKTGAASGVRVLTRMGIPVFLRPPAPQGSAVIAGFGQVKPGFALTLRNTGNVHFVPDRVRVTGFSDAGQQVFDTDLKTWYVLAGGTRVFTFDVSRPECERIRSLTADILIGPTSLKGRLETPASACGT